MVACRFISADTSSIGEREFEAVGQRAVLSEAGFREAVLGGAGFIQEEQFARIGFTQEELDKHGPVGMRNNPPAPFCEKLLKAQAVYRDLRDSMLHGSNDVLSTETC